MSETEQSLPTPHSGGVFQGVDLPWKIFRVDKLGRGRCDVTPRNHQLGTVCCELIMLGDKAPHEALTFRNGQTIKSIRELWPTLLIGLQLNMRFCPPFPSDLLSYRAGLLLLICGSVGTLEINME